MKNVIEKIKDVFTGLLSVVAIGMMIFTVVSVFTLNQRDRNIFGYRAFIVLSDSMKASGINAGDVVVVKETDPTTLEVGDIIAYISQDPDFFGETVTHMIRKVTTNDNGDRGFVTYGTTTGVDDKVVVTYPYILGELSVTLPKVGTFFTFLKTTPGYIMCILIPFLLLIGMQGWDCVVLFREYKKEEMEEIMAEKAQLEEERKRSMEMMQELLALKQQLGQTVPVQGAPAAQTPAQPAEAGTAQTAAAPAPINIEGTASEKADNE